MKTGPTSVSGSSEGAEIPNPLGLGRETPHFSPLADKTFISQKPDVADKISEPIAYNKKIPGGNIPGEIKISKQAIVTASASGEGTLDAPSVHGSATWETILGMAILPIDTDYDIWFGGETYKSEPILDFALPLSFGSQAPTFPEGEVRGGASSPYESFSSCKECAEGFVRVIDCGSISDAEIQKLPVYEQNKEKYDRALEKFHMELFIRTYKKEETPLCANARYMDLEIKVKEKEITDYLNPKKKIMVSYYQVNTQKVPVQLDGIYYITLIRKTLFKPQYIGAYSPNAFSSIPSQEVLLLNIGGGDASLLRLVRVVPGKIIPLSITP